MTKLACTRMDLLAAGMSVDPPQVADGKGLRDQDSVEGDVRTGKVVLTPGSAEEWVQRKGHEGDVALLGHVGPS